MLLVAMLCYLGIMVRSSVAVSLIEEVLVPV